MKPTKNRIFCRECGRAKMLFESEKKAMNFIKFNSEEFDSKTPNRAYYCEACGGWHVTSREGQSYINPFVENIINQYKQTKEYRKPINPYKQMKEYRKRRYYKNQEQVKP